MSNEKKKKESILENVEKKIKRTAKSVMKEVKSIEEKMVWQGKRYKWGQAGEGKEHDNGKKYEHKEKKHEHKGEKKNEHIENSDNYATSGSEFSNGQFPKRHNIIKEIIHKEMKTENKELKESETKMKEKTFDKNEKGITAEKDDFSEWFTQIMLKADLADYTSVSGCLVIRPTAYAIWEKIKEECDKRFKKLGIKNAYFPLLIPEKTMSKEQEHVEGFAPEVAWVTEAGNTKLNERLAIRPTSETIIYESYSKWIRSWRDLPLKLNLWNNVIRWEFKHPVPFLRTREFLWNEGHTVFATKEEAEKEKDEIIGIYKDVCEDFLALPSLIGKKSKKETFPGAEYTISMEFYMPNGRCIQGPDFHHDGQNFAKAYNIKFLSKDGKEEYAWQNTWAISTRMLGVMFAVHSDSKGLILPPKVAPNKIVIVPILFEDSKEKVLKKCREISRQFENLGAILDDREEYKPGWKFNEWEMKGIPLRIEIGPRDLESESVMVYRRDNGKKEAIKLKDLKIKVEEMLEDIQKSLHKRAQELLKNAIVEVSTLDELKKAVEGKKIGFVPLCKSRACEDELKFKSGGAKALNIPEEQPSKLGKSVCVMCKKKAEYFAYIGKSY